jgi:hypothetical protein
MDPVSMGGIALSAVSLTFQLFSGCIKGMDWLEHFLVVTYASNMRYRPGYSLLSDAKSMPNQFQYLRVRLKTEQHRMLDWARVANLSVQDNTLGPNLRLNLDLVQEVLREKDKILSQFWNIDRRHKCAVADSTHDPVVSEPSLQLSPLSTGRNNTLKRFQDRFPHEEDSLEWKALNFVQRLRRYPARIRWAAFDQEMFEKLLAQLASLNDFMRGLLDSEQQVKFYQEQLQTTMQILQLNNKVDHLLQIFKAASMPLFPITTPLPEKLQALRIDLNSVPRSDTADDVESSQRTVLARLARFKALSTTIEGDHLDPEFAATINISSSISEAANPRLNPKSCVILRSSSAGKSLEVERSEGLYDGEPVWIEWKYYEPAFEHGMPDPFIERRIANLASLLHDEDKPEGFRAPSCLGYFNDWERENQHNRFGLVFRKPLGVSRHTLWRPSLSCYGRTSLPFQTV